MSGGSGDDSVTGGRYVDILSGGQGNDTLSGGNGDDFLIDGEGDDRLFGGAGSDRLSRNDNAGTDQFDGGAGTDTLAFGGFLSAVLDLEDQSRNDGVALNLTVRNIEAVIGTFVDDELLGSAAAENLQGGSGDDILNGRAGDDTLIGGSGDDLLTGGAGADHFVLFFQPRTNEGDIITDFTGGTDKLVIGRNWGITEADEIRLITGDAPQAETEEATFLFETDTGRLWFDSDGSGNASEMEFIALLQGVTSLSLDDFLLDDLLM